MNTKEAQMAKAPEGLEFAVDELHHRLTSAQEQIEALEIKLAPILKDAGPAIATNAQPLIPGPLSSVTLHVVEAYDRVGMLRDRIQGLLYRLDL